MEGNIKPGISATEDLVEWCKFSKLFSQYFTTEAVGSHNYQRTYSLLFNWQGELLLPLTDILFYIYLLIADYVRR